MRRVLLLLVAGATVSGCATMLNPYDEDYYCRATDEGGKCMDVLAAYTDAVVTGPEMERHLRAPPGKVAATPPAPPPAAGPPGTVPAPPLLPAADLTPREQYLAARDAKLADLLREPKTPLLAPPKLLRVLILPYKEKGDAFDELFMYRYTYLKLENSDFVLTDYIPEPGQ